MRVGILGGGQLARMLALAGLPMGIGTIAFDPSADACAQDITELMIAAYDDTQALKRLCNKVDVITIENENIPSASLRLIQQSVAVYPGERALSTSQDRLIEKQCFTALDIPCAPFCDITSKADLQHACEKLGLPAILKTRRFGYDGKGQFKINQQTDIDIAWNTLGEYPCILEAMIDFDKEISIIATRNISKESVFYPLTKNTHVNGILHRSEAPDDTSSQLQQQAEAYAQKLMDHLNYVGTLAIEFFVTDHQLIANEFAPRVHNSGHWTIEGAVTSQFENHLRAILNLPLGSTAITSGTILENCIGELPDINEVLKNPNSHLHDYGKSSRPGRKVGHITTLKAS